MDPKSVLILFGVFASLVLSGGHSQLLPQEIPHKLQYLVKWDLDRWKPPKEISDDFQYYLSGFDYENRPIWILEFGRWDIATLLTKGDNELEGALSKHIDQCVWKLYNSTGLRATPRKPVKEVVVIIDMNGYDRRQINSAKAVAFVIKKMRTITNGLQFAHEAFIVNANVAAQSLLSVLRPILGKGFERLQVFGTNPSKYQPVLLKNLPRDQIPEEYGGAKDFAPFQIYG